MNISLTKYSGAESKSIFDLPELYYTPETIDFFGKPERIEPSTRDMIEAYFVASGDKVYGYHTGINGVNIIHGTTQVPVHIDIKSNKVNEEKFYKSGYTRYSIHPSEIEINSDNRFYLMMLDIIENYHYAFEEDIVTCTKDIIHELKLDRKGFESLLPMYSQKTKGVIKNVFASK